MSQLLPFFILTPLLGLLIAAFPDNKQEKLIFYTAITAISIHLLGMAGITMGWIAGDFEPFFYKGPELYKTNTSEFSIDFYFDLITVVYGLVAGILLFLVSIFSRYYMHREKGFKRFFNNLLLFYLGINFIIFAGNFETLFVGWEIIGIASFFLIAFYRDRYLPVKNALKVVSLYRVADIFLLLAIWLCHHAFSHNITFLDLHDLQSHHATVIENASFQLIIPMVFLVVAAIKSAQFPFSSWLPRAMEGPTTSSAIFYGSLSVHIGAFLMLRTMPFWENNLVFRGVVIALGLITSLVATAISRVQSTVKTQIAYSSIAQIGIIFVEIGLGLEVLALIHFAGNAFLRTYQLLVSPSVLNYLIHEQFFNFIPPQHNFDKTWIGRLKASVFILSIKEWNLDTFMYRFMWQPLKWFGGLFSFLSGKTILFAFLPLHVIGVYFAYHQDSIPHDLVHQLPVFFAALGVIMALRAFVERGSAVTGWWFIVMNQLFTSLSIAFNEQFGFDQIHLYLSGSIVFSIVGYLCLVRLKRERESVDLQRFHGHSYERPRLTVVFLLASLGLSGFPISPTFIGEDLIIGHIHEDQYLLTTLTALSLILDGLSVFRIYARVFLGPHDKGYHEYAYKSS